MPLRAAVTPRRSIEPGEPCDPLPNADLEGPTLIFYRALKEHSVCRSFTRTDEDLHQHREHSQALGRRHRGIASSPTLDPTLDRLAVGVLALVAPPAPRKVPIPPR